MALPIPTPSDVIGLTRSAVTVPARALRVIDDIEALVKRVGGIADRAEAFLDRLETLADRAGALIDGVDAAVTDAEAVLERTRAVSTTATAQVERVTRVVTAAGLLVDEVQRLTAAAGGTVTDARAVITEAETVALKANGVVDKAEATAGTADELLGGYAPALRRGAPMAHRFVEQLSEDEVDAAIKLIDELPRFTKHMDEDILPILATLDRVGPDIHELLDVTRELRLAVKGIPGLRLLTKRGQELDD
ncbi:hypothetical protein O7635_16320 [Asanoa sp. WMMD1127]|uniref:hypothetical protein n=1 Tax=Asanoa sp. WMMD1127 TaxID=3016107 RepID=UPI0024166E4E|nr:hypothetical protein [Asanoa sp. WMMD1127]MDG4823423.1 hypothetical protein [Asanoa sp. WMMD1127]